jgi:hypothetical protein
MKHKASHNVHSSEAGVTLLLSILILAAITAIALSLATVLLIEIRTSGDLQRSEPALFATQGILEEAIFKIKHNVSDAVIPISGNCTGISLGCTLNGVTLTTTIGSRNPDASITETIVPSNAVDYATTKYKYYLIDPDDPYDCTNGGTPTCYSQVTITNTGQPGSHADLSVGLCEMDADDCVLVGFDSEDTSLTPGEAVTFGSPILLPSKPYYIVIKNNSAGFTNVNGFVQIATLGPTGTGLGLPYFGKKVVDVSAGYIGLTRKYRALIPTQ